jgi:hypothetical protein
MVPSTQGCARSDAEVLVPPVTLFWGETITGMIRDFEHRYRAVRSRDARFDGWFYVAVTSPGIYCHPSCPSVTPKHPRMCFLKHNRCGHKFPLQRR